VSPHSASRTSSPALPGAARGVVPSQCSWTTLRCAGRPGAHHEVGCVAVTYACIEVAVRALTVQTGHTQAMQHNPNTLIDLSAAMPWLPGAVASASRGCTASLRRGRR
jgi:hypothetical protein